LGVLAIVFVLAVGLGGCSNSRMTKSASARSKAVAASSASVDPMLAAPPTGATMDSGSQQVPLGELSGAHAAPNAASPEAKSALLVPPAGPPVPLVPQSSASTAAVPPAASPPAPPPAATKPAPPMARTKGAAATPQPMTAPPPLPATPTVVAKVPEPVPAKPPQLKVPDTKAPAVAAAEPDNEGTVVISSATPGGATGSREFIPALVPDKTVLPEDDTNAPLGVRPLTAAEKNVAERFEILKMLLDADLITADEYARHRNANLGALLPFTHDPPSVGLERPVPSGDAIVARLEALRRSLELRAITPRQHAMERAMIISALLPDELTDRAEPMPPPSDVIQGATIVSHLQALRAHNLISADELDTEHKAIDQYLRTGSFAVASAPESSHPKPAAKAAPAEPPAEEGTAITGPVLHLASFRSEEAAKQGWQEAVGKAGKLLSNVHPIIRKVDLGAEKGIFYRLLAGPYTSMAEAETACMHLKAVNQFCVASADGT
jgi:hypothetical protein